MAIQIEVEMPTDAVTHSPTCFPMALLIARATPSGPSRLRSGVPARFSDASSIDIRRTSGECVSRISISWSETSRYFGGSGSRMRIGGKIAFASKTFIPVLMPRSRASRDEETIVAASVA